MKFFALVFLSSILSFSFVNSPNFCVKPEEKKLYDLLMAYRAENGLKPIPLSTSLTQVAKWHVFDLATNQPAKGNCNLHSWSKSENWEKCCYTNNHKKAECMWNKPRELTQYMGDGFEIAAYLPNGPTAQNALNGWKKSNGHNRVMINKGNWKNMQWKSVGIGIQEDYAVIWFGIEDDPEKTELTFCEK